MKAVIRSLVRFSAKTKVGRYVHDQILDKAMGRTQLVAHQQVQLNFAIPNSLNKYRVDSFSSKEPETLAWIDSFEDGAVVWDIGANVGLYTCYAAKSRGCRVFAFEPSVFNLELLARNINLNQLATLVTIVPLPIADQMSFSDLNLTTTEWGGALSTFKHLYGQDGKPLQRIFQVPTVGISMHDAVSILHIPQPDHIKIDVDGIEHLILKGGVEVLRKAKSVSIEINDMFPQQADDSATYLREAGLTFSHKRHCRDFDDHPLGRSIFNQVWINERHGKT